MQSCLEKRGVEERKNEIEKSDYSLNDQYSREHKDATSDGDNKGRGSKYIKSHTSWKPHQYNSPDMTSKNTINYNNFDALDETLGNCYDINGRFEIGGRKKNVNYSLYNSSYQYNKDLIGTTYQK